MEQNSPLTVGAQRFEELLLLSFRDHQQSGSWTVHRPATVVLPGYFEALNRDFRYQLTVIGQFAQAIVAKEINQGRFIIKTNKPGVKVSWQVTGIRQDAWANAHRIPNEQDKPAAERGHYLHPELYGASAEKNTDAMLQR